MMFGKVNSGVIGGLVLMLISMVWFFAGLVLGGFIFYAPPVLFCIGLAAVVRGLAQGQY
jgi:hypothetical protein